MNETPFSLFSNSIVEWARGYAPIELSSGRNWKETFLNTFVRQEILIVHSAEVELLDSIVRYYRNSVL